MSGNSAGSEADDMRGNTDDMAYDKASDTCADKAEADRIKTAGKTDRSSVLCMQPRL